MQRAWDCGAARCLRYLGKRKFSDFLNLRLLKVQPGREQSREPFLRAVRV